MTLLHLHHDDLHGLERQDTSWIEKAFQRAGAAVRTFHRAIVRARLRRPQSEWLFRKDYSDMLPPEQQDATKFPQRPLILGDKWDF